MIILCIAEHGQFSITAFQCGSVFQCFGRRIF